MTRPSQWIRDLSAQILERQIGGRESPFDLASAIEGGFTQLYALLSDLIGPAGFRAVCGRAVHLAEPEAAWLHSAQIQIEDRVVIRDLTQAIERDGVVAVVAGAAALLAHLIALFCTFIGEDLTLRLIGRRWPDLAPPEGGAGRVAE